MTTLSHEQELALQSLIVPRASVTPDLLQTWLGISGADLRSGLDVLLNKKDALQRGWLERIERQPMDAAFEFLAGAAMAFYLAEKDANPKITSYVDAFYYIATCASVGYADIFAATQTGRAVASLVMIVGPSLTSKALDRPLAGIRTPKADANG
jgi:hypothetical protein